jgi:hypothetical protein
MRIAPSFAAAQHQPTPAESYVAQASWLLAPGSVVTALVPLDANTVRVMVADPLNVDPSLKNESDHLAADSAMAVLEQAAHGVRLLPTTDRGYVGRMQELAPAQLTFPTCIPGVRRHDLVPRDLDGNGVIDPSEVVHRIEVATKADVARIDWLLRDRVDDGVVYDGPVEIVVPDAQPSGRSITKWGPTVGMSNSVPSFVQPSAS